MKIHSVINKSFQTRKGASVLVESARDMGWVVELMEVGPEWHMWKKPMKVDDRLGKIPHDMLLYHRVSYYICLDITRCRTMSYDVI